MARVGDTEDLFEANLSHMRVRRANPRADGQLKHTLNRPEYATALGLARFALDTSADEYGTATGDGSWKGRVRSLFSMFGGK